MRECTGENVSVYEIRSETASDLFAQVAVGLEVLEPDASYIKVDNLLDPDGHGYMALIYVHQ